MSLKHVFVIITCYFHSHALHIMLPLDQEGHTIAVMIFQATGSFCFIKNSISSPTTNMYLVVLLHDNFYLFGAYFSSLTSNCVLFSFFLFNNFACNFLRKIWKMGSLSLSFASFKLEQCCFKVSHKINTKFLFKFFIYMLGTQVIESLNIFY